MASNSSRPADSSRIDVIARLLKLSWRYRSRSLQVFLLQVVLLAMTLSALSFSGLAVDVIRHSLDATTRLPNWPLSLEFPRHWSLLAQLLLIAVAILLTAGTGAILNYSYSVTVGRLVHLEIVPHLRAELFTRLQRLSFRFFDKNSNGAIVNRVTVDVQMLRSFVDGVIIQGSVLLLSLGVFLGYMLHTHVKLTLVSLALTPLLYVTTRLFSRWAQPAYRAGRQLSDNMVRAMAEGIEGIQVTKVFGRAKDQFASFDRRNRAVREQQLKIFQQVSRFSPTVDFLNQANIAVLLVYGGWLVSDGSISLGDLVIFTGLLRQFASRASGMADIINTLQQSMTGARRVFEIFDAPVEVKNRDRCIMPGRLTGKVHFEQVHFCYTEDAVLRGITFEAKPGQSIGILGATGSGKSTLLSLVPRFYDPTQGRVLIDDIDVRDFDIDGLRRQIGVVFQESLLFRETIANNIAFGHPEATRDQVERAARIACAHRFICELPNGYDTVLEEGAANLSGGQRQRIAIARALLLEPPILLLDDPTTAIDAITEAEVLRAVDGAMAGRTTFLISNRLSALRRTDTILVLESGSIIEQGTHQQLLKQGGLYSQTARLTGTAILEASTGENREEGA
jgi:ATP-binding cassette, subfamily B, bacterial